MAKINLSHNNEHAQILQGENDSQIRRYNKYEKEKRDSTPTTNAQREREWEETEEEQRRSIRSKTKKANKSSMIRGHQMIFISFSYREWTLIQFVKISCFEKEGR